MFCRQFIFITGTACVLSLFSCFAQPKEPVTVDGKSPEVAGYGPGSRDPNSRDSLARKSSVCLEGEIDPGRVARLRDLGMIRGFLKYYHPAVGRGDYNWDSVLFRILPLVINARDSTAAYAVEEGWVDGLGKVSPCNNCRSIVPGLIVQAPDYGYLFDAGHLPVSLQQKLAAIRDNHVADPDHYYVGFYEGTGNPIFRHEDKYESSPYPPSAIRLLSLYRYWNMIQYFYPNRHLIREDWNTVLGDHILRFIRAADTTQYLQACLELIAHIHDTHANIWGYYPRLEFLKGLKRMPFDATFAEGKLVVTGYLVDSPDLGKIVPPGTIIRSIDEIPVDSLVRRYLPLTPASNYPTQLRDLVGVMGFLLRSNAAMADLEVENGGVVSRIRLDLVPLDPGRRRAKEVSHPDKSFLLLDKNIGYIKPSKLKEKDLDSIRVLFAHTKGVIIDMRCYPSQFMPFSYGAWLKAISSPFVSFSHNDLNRPGNFVREKTISNGGGAGVDTKVWNPQGQVTDCYKGRVIMIVDASTQSQAEYTIMALQTVPGSLVIGSTTAGADGNVSEIYLPGNIFSYISGIGIYYVDGTETQRVGVRIDKLLQLTVKGIREGRDEFLEEAKQLIRE